MKTKAELCLFGGTFSPVHNGHLNAVTAYLSEYMPDEMYIIPSFIPPHKAADFSTSPRERLQMLKLALSVFPEYGKRLFVSDYEIENAAVSYTVNTLRHFSSEDRHLTFLCGTDMFLSLEEWREYTEIFRLARIACIKRNTDDVGSGFIGEAGERYRRLYNADVIYLNAPALELSSTEIRRRISKGNDVSALLPDAVYNYIIQKGLYGYAKNNSQQ